jgi:cytochrome c oxidase subunit I+III
VTAASLATLERAWASPTGFGPSLSAVNHRVIGTRYMVTSLVFFAVAGVEALVIRAQLAAPELGIVGPELYNQLFTMHGSTMMFLFVVPFLEGLGIYLVPLMIGARDMVFPRLNAFGYWVYLVAGVALHISFLAGAAPHSGWFNYVPLTGRGFSPGIAIDFWVTMITFLEVAALVAAVELIVTIFRQRAPGMSLDRMPLFVWAMLVTSFMIVFAMPALVVASLLLGLDRFAGMHFFDVAGGGDPLLWQHLFWYFGHPDVYIMLLPALGVVSTIVPALSGRPIAGYRLHVVAFVTIGFVSFGLWIHHMYATGLPIMGMNFFVAASMVITIPSGIQIVSWIVTLWRGTPRLEPPLLFVVGFILLFVLGGITGIMIASVPFDWQVHDTHFIVAHFHYVLFGGVVFPIFAAAYFWFPKLTGRRLRAGLGRLHFWLTFVGFNLTFGTLHVAGLQGMPRRVYTYPAEVAWTAANALASAGAALMGLGVLLFFVNLALSARRGEPAGENPWGASTLEWSVASPPPAWNFQTIPVVRGREPLWESPPPEAAAPELGWRSALAHPDVPRRETPITTALDAEPDHLAILPGPSPWPLWTALAVTVAFAGAMLDLWLVPAGGLLTGLCLLGWHRRPRERDPIAAPHAAGMLPAAARGRSVVWSGMAVFVLIEATGASALLVSYFYLRLGVERWPPPGVELPSLTAPSIALVLLLASVVPMALAERAARRDRGARPLLLLPAAALGALGYAALTVWELSTLPFRWHHHAYGSIVFTVSGYQVLHAIVILALAAVLWVGWRRDGPSPRGRAGLEALALYWYFVAGSSALVFVAVELSPWLL